MKIGRAKGLDRRIFPPRQLSRITRPPWHTLPANTGLMISCTKYQRLFDTFLDSVIVRKNEYAHLRLRTTRTITGYGILATRTRTTTTITTVISFGVCRFKTEHGKCIKKNRYYSVLFDRMRLEKISGKFHFRIIGNRNDVSFYKIKILFAERFSEAITRSDGKVPEITVDRLDNRTDEVNRYFSWSKFASMVSFGDIRTLRRICLHTSDGIQEVSKKSDPSFQRSDIAIPYQEMARTDDIPEEISTLMARENLCFGWMKRKREGVSEETVNLITPYCERLGIGSDDGKIIHIADIIFYFQSVFYKLVQFIEIDIGEELARITPDRKSYPFWSSEE